MKSGQTCCSGYPLCCSGESVSTTEAGCHLCMLFRGGFPETEIGFRLKLDYTSAQPPGGVRPRLHATRNWIPGHKWYANQCELIYDK